MSSFQSPAPFARTALVGRRIEQGVSMPRGAAFVATALFLCGLGLAVSGRPLFSQAEAQYTGTEACLECHDERAADYPSNPHHRAEFDPDLVAERVGCESCHGPGSLHAESEGDPEHPGYASIRIFKGMASEPASAVCRDCHATGAQMYWDHSAHAGNDVGCTECHTIHQKVGAEGTTLLAAGNTNDLCLRCHQGKRASMARSGHMPLPEGGMTCADCHNPHGSLREHQLVETSNTELCLRCHTDKRGPFLWEHAPVREDCLTCHEPHGSNSDKVLAAKRPFLCQRCHDMTRHPSTLYDLPDLESNRLFNRSCTNCHAQIHGSNHPSGHTFLR
jgi:DmsE family decaheme c-type cytochrome